MSSLAQAASKPHADASGRISTVTMKAVERYFEKSLYLTVLCGFGTLAQTGQIDPFSVLLVIGALTIRGYLLIRRKRFLVSERWTKYLTLVFAGWYGVDWYWISGTFVSATVHLVLALLVVRLFSAHRDRDFVFLAILAFLLVLAASVLTVDSTFLIGFAAFLLTAVATFILLDMKRSASAASVQAREAGDGTTHQQLGVALGVATPVLMIAILTIAVAIFFILPRLSAGYLSAYASAGDLSTGFSDRVELGRIGQIQQSTSVVMHVAITGDHSGEHADLLWRGIALNQFDGKNWLNTEKQVVVPRAADGRFLLPSTFQHPPAYPIHYRVLLEPLGTNIFFVANEPRTLEGGYRMITTDAGGAFYDLDREHPVGLYEGESDLPRRLPESLPGSQVVTPPATSFSPALRELLQLPEVDPRIPQLAREITAQAKNDNQRAAQIESYLRTHFGYTLDLGRVRSKDPVANFLFERKRGHCEYFASAMAVMLRTLGIPSRVVNGFRAGEFNDITSQYVVRMRNAHSWVEAYLPGRGWVTFDPTPGDSIDFNGRPSRFMMYLDAASSFWREWVVNYDFQHQRVLGQQATNSSRQWFDRARDWGQERYDALLSSARRLRRKMVSAPRAWTIVGLFLVVLLLFSMNAKAAWSIIRTFRLASQPERAPQKAASIWYERMTRKLAKRGWRKLPHQTPAEFANSIHDLSLRRTVSEFTDRYEKARFADSPDDAKQLPELYEEIDAGR